MTGDALLESNDEGIMHAVYGIRNIPQVEREWPVEYALEPRQSEEAVDKGEAGQSEGPISAEHRVDPAKNRFLLEVDGRPPKDVERGEKNKDPKYVVES